MPKTLARKLSLVMALLLLIGGIIYGVWLDRAASKLISNEELQRSLTTARTLQASLKTMMLSGRADLAHDWQDRLSGTSGIGGIRIYRSDGTEAFVDTDTIDKVNRWLGEERFHRAAPDRAPGHIEGALASDFAAVAGGQKPYTYAQTDAGIRLLFPITRDEACMQCHGYTEAPVRGVMALDITPAKEVQALGMLKRDTFLIGAFMMLVFLALASGFIQGMVLAPLADLAGIARRISRGDIDATFPVARPDEFGDVARAMNDLVQSLKHEVAGEADLRRRQQMLTETVIELSREQAGEAILRKLGETAMRIIEARYAMVSWSNRQGEKQFIPLGISEAETQRMAHPPEGRGLLGLIWKEGKTVLCDDIAGHPESCGFPAGHPPMHSFVGAPIRFGEEIIGALYLTEKQQGGSFTEADARLIEALAGAAGIALAHARSREEIEEANRRLEERVAARTHELEEANERLRAREVELEIVNEELVRANEAKNQFLANTSHELRTPLNAIIGFSELLGNPKLGELNAKQQRYVENVHTSGKRLLHIINDLLDISKIESGMMNIEETPFVPADIARQVVNELLPLASSKNIEIGFSAGEECMREVCADQQKLHQMMVNLLGNAIKFTPEEGRIDVELGLRKASGGDMLKIVIRDTGIGIKSEDLEKIFEPFVQAEGGLGRKYEGTGLGLALTRKMARLLGGDVTAESRVGSGSSFTIDLPVVRSGSAEVIEDLQHQHEATSAEEISGKASIHEPEHAPCPRVLVLDDDQQRADAVTGMLATEGYEVVQCADLEHCMQLQACAVPFMVLLGVHSDAEVMHHRLQAVKTHPFTRDIPLMLVGGTAARPEFSAGTLDVFSKHLDQRELVDVISRFGRMLPMRPEIPTILVIDDEPSVRELIREMLVEEGYRVISAQNGKEGLRLAIEHEPDLIILDLMMPGTTGFDVMAVLRRHPAVSEIPVLIYTAKDLSRAELLQLGQQAERVLIKGENARGEILRQLHKLELLYPAKARLVDRTLGCFNPRYVRRRLQQEVANAQRHHLQFSLVGWRMEHYADYISEHGERWGIAALKEMLEMVRSVTRRGDVVARLEEAGFVLLLPGITPTGARRVAEKLRLRIRHHRFPLPKDAYGSFTASFFIVHFPDDAEDADTLQSILRQHLKEPESREDLREEESCP